MTRAGAAAVAAAGVTLSLIIACLDDTTALPTSALGDLQYRYPSRSQPGARFGSHSGASMPPPGADATPPSIVGGASFGLNVRDYGAKGDSTTDDTAAFSAALTAAANAGGTIVYVPEGQYLINGTLTVPTNVVLQGTLPFPPTGCGGTNGSTILTTHGHGDESAGAALSLACNAALQSLKIVHPLQSDPKNIVPYPWTVQQLGDDASIINVLMQNPYKAVNFGVSGGRHYVRGLYGQPLKMGIFVDKCYDIGRIADVHFWPFWSNDATPFTQANGVAFTFARSDWQYVEQTFAFGYNIGYHFVESTQTKGACNGNFLGLGSDATFNASVYIEQSDAFGLLFTNAELVAMGANASTQIIVAPSNTGSVRFVNSALWGPAQQVADISGSGTVGLSDCTIMWTAGAANTAIHAHGNGTVLFRGNEFKVDAPQIELDASLSKAVVTDNVLTGTARITDHGVKNKAIANNVADA